MVCQRAMHALVCKQRHFFTAGEALPAACCAVDLDHLEDAIDYVWRKLIKYTNESRLSRTGKAAFVARVQRSFATEAFVSETRTWLQAEVARVAHPSEVQLRLTPEKRENEAAAAARQPLVMEEPVEEAPSSLELDHEEAAAPAGLDDREEAAAELPLGDRKNSEEEAERESSDSVLSGEDQAEDLLVQFSRTARKYAAKRSSYQGWGYALTVYVLYFAFAFVAVYLWSSSHCTTSAQDDVFLPQPTVNSTLSGTKVGVQLKAGDIHVVKTAITIGRFGGVYGADWGSSAFVFDADESDRLYQQRYGVPAPRPSCAATCTRQLVCRNPKCITYNASFDAQSVDIHDAKIGSECHCSVQDIGPVWDSCGVSGWLLMVVRNYWLTMYYGIAILEVTSTYMQRPPVRPR